MLLGDKVLIQLDKYDEQITSPSGLVIPLVETDFTDSGKITSRPSPKQYLSVGTILDLSTYAYQKLRELNPHFPDSFGKGSRVLVAQSAVNPHYQYSTDRSHPSPPFDGIIAITHQLLDAII